MPTGRRQPVGYLQAWPRIWTRDDREQIQQVARAELKPGAARLRVRRADHSATLPPVIRMHKFRRQQRLVKQVVSLILSIFVTLGTFHKRNWSCPQFRVSAIERVKQVRENSKDPEGEDSTTN